MDKSQQDSFYSYPELEAIRLLFELMSDPSQYSTAVESYVARITSRLAWGTPTGADELKQRARELLIGVSPTGALGNKIPAVMSLPERLSPAKAWEMRRGRTERKFFETMQSDVRRSLSNEKGSPAEVKQSWTRMFLENKLSWGFDSDLEGAYAVGMHGKFFPDQDSPRLRRIRSAAHGVLVETLQLDSSSRSSLGSVCARL